MLIKQRWSLKSDACLKFSFFKEIECYFTTKTEDESGQMSAHMYRYKNRGSETQKARTHPNIHTLSHHKMSDGRKA